jgi:hypothetical protein
MVPRPGFTIFTNAPSSHSKDLVLGENTNAHSGVLAGFPRQSRARNSLVPRTKPSRCMSDQQHSSIQEPCH